MRRDKLSEGLLDSALDDGSILELTIQKTREGMLDGTFDSKVDYTSDGKLEGLLDGTLNDKVDGFFGGTSGGILDGILDSKFDSMLD